MRISCAPMAIAALLFLVVSLVWHDRIPSGLDPEEWHNFTKNINADLSDESSREGFIYALVCVHAAQTVLGFPLMHITKILYGYILGTVRATLLACMWEMFLVTAFTLFFEQYIKVSESPLVFKNLIKFVKDLRETDRVRFYVFVFCFQLSSIPLITAISFVLYSVISTRDFLVSHLFVTFIMSLKDAWLGNFINNSDADVKNVVVGCVVFVASTCVPTIVSCVLLSHVFYFLKKNQTEMLDDDEKKLLDDLVLFEDLDCTRHSDSDKDTEFFYVGGATEGAEANEATEATETIDATEATEATKTIDATEATEATETIDATEATEATEATGDTEDRFVRKEHF